MNQSISEVVKESILNSRIEDSLTSIDPTRVLSAKQGSVLKGLMGTVIADGEIDYQSSFLQDMVYSGFGITSVNVDSCVDGTGVYVISASEISYDSIVVHNADGTYTLHSLDTAPNNYNFTYNDIAKVPNQDLFMVSCSNTTTDVVTIYSRTSGDASYTFVADNTGVRTYSGLLKEHTAIMVLEDGHTLLLASYDNVADIAYFDTLDLNNIGAGWTEVYSTAMAVGVGSVSMSYGATANDIFITYGLTTLGIIHIFLDDLPATTHITTSIASSKIHHSCKYNRAVNKFVAFDNPTTTLGGGSIVSFDVDGSNKTLVRLLSDFPVLRDRVAIFNDGSSVVIAGGYDKNKKVVKVGLTGVASEIIKSKVFSADPVIAGRTNAISLHEPSSVIDSGAYGRNALTQGIGTKAQNNNQVSIGEYNVGTDANTILEVGVGTGDITRANALEVFKDGTVTIPEATIAEIDARGIKALITKEYLAQSVIDNLTTNDSLKPLSANQGLVLKGFIDSINTLLTSDDTTLDELQEIVTFIKQNKTTLDTLGIANIAGLETALGTTEKHANKRTSVSGFQATPDDTAYISEKLAKDSLDAKSNTTHNHAGTYEPVDANIVRKNVSNIFTAPQRVTVESKANALDLSGTGEIEFTATPANITVVTMPSKKWLQGSMTIHSSENVTGWGAEFRFAPDFSAVTPTPPANMTGTMKFWFEVMEVNGVDGGLEDIIYVAWAS